MRIRWTPVAAADLQGIYDYLREHEPHLARPTVIEIRSHSLQKIKPRPSKGGFLEEGQPLAIGFWLLVAGWNIAQNQFARIDSGT
jgi:hypothetical protein